MSTYYFTETQNINCHLTDNHYEKIIANSLSSAKRMATKRKCFQGTCLQLFIKNVLKIRICYKESEKDGWIDDYYA